MGVQTGLITVEEFLRLPPAREGHYELHHGEVVLVPPPKRGHHRVQDRIQMLLKRLVGDKGSASMEMAFRPALEHEVWVADVGFVIAVRDAGDDEYIAGAPDLVVEVLSPSNKPDEIKDRIAICMENGCRSFWVVDSKRKRVSVTEGGVTREYGADESFWCEVVGAAIPVREIFE